MSYQYEFEQAMRELTPLSNYTPAEFQATSYEVTAAIEAIHNYPRFGKTNNITGLIEAIGDGDDETTSESLKQYALGIFAGAILILCIAVLWFFVIAMLKIAGHKKVGLFAGTFVRPTTTSSDGQGVEVVTESTAVPSHPHDPVQRSFRSKVILVRSIFILCGILTIVGSVLFYTKGVYAFRESIDAMTRGIDLVQEVAAGAINVTDSVILNEDSLQTEMSTFLNNTEGEPAEPFCRVTPDEASNQIRELWQGLVTSVLELKVLVAENLDMVSEDLQTLIDITENVQNQLTAADIVFWILIVVSIFIICFIAVMLGSVLFAMMGVSNFCTKCITNAVIWPIFTLLLVLSWILSTVFLIASLAGADFCIDPDAYVMTAIDQYKGEFKSAIFSFALFYISGCKEKPIADGAFITILETIVLINSYVHELALLIGDYNPRALAAVCGIDADQAAAIQTLSTFLHNLTHLMNRSMIGVIDLLSCASFNPIYTTFIHDALCSGGVQGLSWIFFTMLTIALSSMMMITFRAALYPIREEAGALPKGDDVEIVKYQRQVNETEEEPTQQVQQLEAPKLYDDNEEPNVTNTTNEELKEKSQGEVEQVLSSDEA